MIALTFVFLNTSFADVSVNVLWGQTSYPMLMALEPAAAQVGQTSEHTLHARYSMYGAYAVFVDGDGVSGEIVPHAVKKGEKIPNLQKLKIRFHIKPAAQPGVRDFRIATPQGVSTLGQLVVTREPVFSEDAKIKNDSDITRAQSVDVPGTVCGIINKNEDVDYYKFKIEKPGTLSFHVLCNRLQNKIHDLQRHSDPILSIRTASLNTLATSDNHFYADPFISHHFAEPGEYYLEIRDVRYHGNPYWTYSIEVIERPFVTNIYPLAHNPHQTSEVELTGFNLPEQNRFTWTAPGTPKLHEQNVQIPLGDDLSNPVQIIVTEQNLLKETNADNNSIEQAQPVTLPIGINGRIDQESDVDYYAFQAKKGDQFDFEVIARRAASGLDSYIRIVNEKGRQLKDNDDLTLGIRKYADSSIDNWTAPADGTYFLEIRDMHLRGGTNFVYYVKVYRSEPHFELFLDTDKTLLSPGNYGVLFARAVPHNGFSGEIELSIDGLPKKISARCGRILEGQKDGCIILHAAEDAPVSFSNITVTGTAKQKKEDDNSPILNVQANPYQEIYIPGGGRGHWPADYHAVSVTEPADIRSIKINQNKITLKPGESQKIEVELERAPEFDKNISLDIAFRHLNSNFANPLPPGVKIDGKNSKTLLNAKESKAHITLVADKNAKPVENQQVAIMAHISINFVMKATYSSEPLLITIADAENKKVQQ